MKKLPLKTAFQDPPSNEGGKIETLKTKIASGEYRINPHNIAEKLMASSRFFMYTRHSRARTRSCLFKPGSF